MPDCNMELLRLLLVPVESPPGLVAALNERTTQVLAAVELLLSIPSPVLENPIGSPPGLAAIWRRGCGCPRRVVMKAALFVS